MRWDTIFSVLRSGRRQSCLFISNLHLSFLQANQLNNYYSFQTDAQPSLGTSDERWGYLVTEKWLEIPFSGTLTPNRAVSGRLYLLVVSPPLLDPEDRPEVIRIVTESTRLRKEGELSEMQFP
eukprot:sb/3475890/